MEHTGNRGRRYSVAEKTAAVRMNMYPLGGVDTSKGTVQSVADQLGFGIESVRSWLRQADIDDGIRGGVTTDEQARMQHHEQETRGLERACAYLKRLVSFFGTEPGRQHRS